MDSGRRGALVCSGYHQEDYEPTSRRDLRWRGVRVMKKHQLSDSDERERIDQNSPAPQVFYSDTSLGGGRGSLTD